MSCGDPHDLDCGAALARLYDYIDNCIEPPQRDRIAVHLQECHGCFDEFAAEELVKALVARSCCQSAPADLRARLVTRIESMTVVPGPAATPPGARGSGLGPPASGFGLVDPLS